MKYQRGPSETRRMIYPDPADRYRYSAAGSYTPGRITRIVAEGNAGDIEELCLCAREILERNWDIQGALDQRAAAICGSAWTVTPGGESDLDKRAAELFEKELRAAGTSGSGMDRAESFDELIRNLIDAVVQPFAASEILWKPGGHLEGFSTIEPHHFTLRDSYTPRLVCDGYPNGLEIPENKVLFHAFRRKPDPARAGKIRVLAWLHCFQNWPIKDLFSFIERFGMPFVVAKVGKAAWDQEREVLKSMIRNFGPDGGGVFDSGTEVQLLNAANTGGDNVYFRALEFTHNAIYVLLTGQLASSSDASGTSNGTAQTAVRQDILESDARSLETTIRTQIAAPWTRFHFGDAAAVPVLQFQTQVPEDLASFATVINTLSQAGFKADEAELSERFGLKLHYEAPQTAPSTGFAMAAEREDKRGKIKDKRVAEKPLSDRSDKSDGGLSDALNQWLGPMADELAGMTDDEISEEEFAKRLKNCSEGKEFGSSEKFEKLSGKDMEKQYANTH